MIHWEIPGGKKERKRGFEVAENPFAVRLGYI
jgi:hypothetical protein